jgi:hypothetical protein
MTDKATSITEAQPFPGQIDIADMSTSISTILDSDTTDMTNESNDSSLLKELEEFIDTSFYNTNISPTLQTNDNECSATLPQCTKDKLGMIESSFLSLKLNLK